MQKFLFPTIFLMGVMLLTSCATTSPEPEVVTPEQKASQLLAWEELRLKTESGLKISKDSPRVREVQVYLREIAVQLLLTEPQIQEDPIGVVLLDKGELVAIPGNRIYISTRVLNRLTGENELVTLLAYGLGLIKNWEPQCSKERTIEAIRFAVKSIYKLGYDVRAISKLNQEGNLPCKPDAEMVRKEISSLAPLRNPIVNTERFIKLKKLLEHK